MFGFARQVGRIVGHSRSEVGQFQCCQLLRPERVAVGHVFLSKSVRNDFVAVDSWCKQRGGKSLVQEPISTRVSRVNGASASVAVPYGKKYRWPCRETATIARR